MNNRWKILFALTLGGFVVFYGMKTIVSAQGTPDPVPPGAITFLAWIEDSWHIATANTDGSDLQDLYGGNPELGEVPTAPLWSPDGQKIMFAVNYTPKGASRDTLWERLYLMNRDGSNRVEIGNFERSTNFFVLNHYVYGGWSPDSKTFIYGYYQTLKAGDSRREFFKADLKGKPVSLNPESAPSYENVLFMNDGRLLMLRADGILLIADQDGQNPELIKADAKINFLYEISPDGKQVLCMLSKSYAFGILDLNTGRFQSINTITDAIVAYEARWSPDGTQFLVQGTPQKNSDAPPSGSSSVWVTLIVSGDGETMDLFEEGPNVLYGRVDWSPDGSYLIFEGTQDGAATLMISRPDGSESVAVTKGAQPDWRPEPDK